MTDLRCYLVTYGSGPRTVKVAAAAAAAGAGTVQVRAKDLPTRGLLELVLAVGEAVAQVAPRTRVLVDDRADVAWAARRAGSPVHGVHLGQNDLPVADARAMLGPDAIIGLTTGTLALVQEAESRRGSDRPDYVGAGPYRLTPTKDSGRPPLGVEGYPPLVAATELPVVAIGDISPADAPPLVKTGVRGIAVVRSVIDAQDPAAVVRAFLDGWR